MKGVEALETRILLKARPIPSQLANRLEAPVPEGLELYLDRLDLAEPSWLERIREATQLASAPKGFVWIVEAPIRTLNGAYFDLSNDDADHRETLRRVILAGAAIGAVAANVHLVAPTVDVALLNPDYRRQALERMQSLLDFYVRACLENGMVPQVENIPPVGRMRESAFVFSPIGTTVGDLEHAVACFPALRLTVDVSHAALFLNWKNASPSDVKAGLGSVAAFCQADDGPTDLVAYVERLAGTTTTIHVSNAAGLLGEGLAYGDGVEDLDGCLGPLVGRVPYFVTETLEPDPNVANGMRDAQSRLFKLRDLRSAWMSR